jgi:hypothetical protein
MYTLILFVYIGMMGKYESNSIAVVPNITTAGLCELAGTQASIKFTHGSKTTEFVCVKVVN